MSDRLEATLHGAIAGVIAASSMTLLRLLARRAGIIDVMVPQAVEQWAREEAGVGRLNPGMHSTLDQLIHLSYGMLWGALYGACTQRGSEGGRGPAALGIAQWLAGPTALLPLLRIAPPPWRQTAQELAVNLAAHTLYAAATAFVTEELSRQGDDPRRQFPAMRRLARIG